jgi:transcriptional regulator of acetoin/glycerol metabolism
MREGNGRTVVPVVGTNAASLSPNADPTANPHDLEEIERATIQRVFDEVQGDKTRAGQLLGISRATLYRKIKRYNIHVAGEPQAAMGAAAGRVSR